MRVFFCVIIALALPLTVGAVSSDFTIGSLVEGDSQAPTIPSITSVTPIASTQIDIQWDPATDDYLLAGYTISRDGSHIATTTLTTFSDTGLTPGTFYEYTVRAFDWTGNVSSASLPVGTTTLVVVPNSTTTPQSVFTPGVASGRLILNRAVTITTNTSVAQFAWGTTRPARFELRWGKTTSYELGFVTTEHYRENQVTSVGDLLPGTTYAYELVGFNTINDIPQLLARGTFTTKVPETIVLPPNVLWLEAVTEGVGATLRWRNPEMADGYSVRVVRSHLQYPTDIHDGMVVYQGRGEDFFDSTALVAYERQYYSVFVIDGKGNISSGAIVGVERIGEGQGDGIVVSESPEIQPNFKAPALLPPTLDPSLIMVAQSGFIQTFAIDSIVLQSSEPFTLSISAAHLPPHLKSIIVTLLDPTDQRRSYTFLLRLNEEKTAYETTLAALQLTGTSRLMVEIYDFNTKIVGRYGKQVDFVLATMATKRVIFPDVFIWYFSSTLFVYTLGVLLICLVLLQWWRLRLRVYPVT